MWITLCAVEIDSRWRVIHLLNLIRLAVQRLQYTVHFINNSIHRDTVQIIIHLQGVSNDVTTAPQRDGGGSSVFVSATARFKPNNHQSFQVAEAVTVEPHL